MLITCNTKCNFGNITKNLNVLFLIRLKVNLFFLFMWQIILKLYFIVRFLLIYFISHKNITFKMFLIFHTKPKILMKVYFHNIFTLYLKLKLLTICSSINTFI